MQRAGIKSGLFALEHLWKEKVMSMKWNKRIAVVTLIICLIITYLPWNMMTVQASELYVDRQADIVFVIDATGSMGPYINSVKAHISDFLNLVSREEVDIKTRFVVYLDIENKEDTYLSEWFTDTASAQAYVSAIKLGSGGDYEETLWDGYGAMLADDFGFRADAHKFCVTLTDAPVKTKNNYGYETQEEVISAIQSKGINSSMITMPLLFSSYSPYVTAESAEGANDGGILGDITGDYSILLKELAETIIKVIKLSEMSPVKGPVGEPTEVTVKAANLEYEEDFKVKMGTKEVAVTEKADGYFKFIVPTDLSAGIYDVKVTNAGVTLSAGTFKLYGPDALNVTGMDPVSGPVGEETVVKVSATGIDYTDNFKVYVGDIAGTVTFTKAAYFKFKTPATLTVGTYPVQVYDDTYGKRTIGTYEYTGIIPDPDPLIVTDITPNSVEQGTACTVKVTATGMNYADDFKVFLDGTECAVTVKQSKYFKFKVTDKMAAGVYNINVSDNTHGVRSIGTFTVETKIPDPDPLKVTLIEPNSVDEGKSCTVKVTATGMNYTDGFKVLLEGTECTVSVKQSKYFKFKVTDKMAAGVYNINVFDNTYGVRSIGTFTVTGKVPDPDPLKITLIEPSSVEEGKGCTVKVTATGMNYADGFKVLLDGTECAITVKQSGYFKFSVPKTQPAGTYSIKVVDNTYGERPIGAFEVTGKVPDPDPFVVSDITPTSAEEGQDCTVKVTATGMNYADGFKVLLDGTECTITVKQSGYFKFSVPKTQSVGAYNIKVVDNTYGERPIGTFEVTGKVPAPDPFVVSDITPTSAEEGQDCTVKVTATGMNYADGFKVLLDGTECTITVKQSEYFKFTVPGTMIKGNYEIQISDDTYGTRTVGNFTVTEKTPPVDPLVINGLEQTSGEVGSTVKINATGMPYGDNFRAYVGGIEAEIKVKQTNYFKIVIPESLSEGEYEINVSDDTYGTRTVGNFTVTAKTS